ncbi:MAG: DUF4190 domain-containing protein [Fimbriimonadia bacterium]|nr:DUF4190 domain-containing protein [Fimbriimonadia bacterium]
MKCPKCHKENTVGNTICAECGASLELLPPPPGSNLETVQVEKSSGVETLIPYRIPQALIAYYCGVFSLIPCFALLVGPAAFIFGVLGLKSAKAHPERKGKAHAWAGIILGGLTFLLNLSAIIFSIVVASANP